MNTTVLEDGTKLKDHWDAPGLPFRIFKSHYGPDILPITKYRKVKFVGEQLLLGSGRAARWLSCVLCIITHRLPPHLL